MNVLITGLMGHVGFSLANYLIKEGHTVIGIINKSKKRYNFNSISKKKLIIKKINLINENTVSKLLKNYKIDKCVHTAAISHEIYAQKDPVNTLNINSSSVLNILNCIKKTRKNIKFINVSTGSVFQEISKKTNINESTVPTPKSLYSVTKRMGEILVSSFNNKGLNCTSIRISWVYGPPIKLNKNIIQRGPIPKIMYDFAINKKKKFRLKNGSNFRASFTYIDDVVSNIYKLLIKKNKLDQIYNLGTGKNNSLKEIFQILKKIDKKIYFKIGPGAQPWSNDSVMRGPLVSKSKLLKCYYNLELGIINYLEWLKKNA